MPEKVILEVWMAQTEYAACLEETIVGGFNAQSDDIVVEAIRDVSEGGVEFAFEMAGSVPALEVAYNVTRRGGTTITTGLPHPERRLELPAASLVAEERTLKGSYIGACVPSRDLPRYMSLYQQGRLPIDRLLSATLKLDDIIAGFDALADGTAVRQVMTFG